MNRTRYEADKAATINAIAAAAGRKTLRRCDAPTVKQAIRSIAETDLRWENAWNGLIWGINTGRASAQMVMRWKALTGEQVATWFASVLAAFDGTPGTAWECWREVLQ